MAHALGDVLESARHDHAPIREAEQHDLVQALVEDVIDDVGDVCRQVDLGTDEMDAFAEAREAWRGHVVPAGAQQRANFPKAVGATPCSMHQYVCCHARSSARRVRLFCSIPLASIATVPSMTISYEWRG